MKYMLSIDKKMEENEMFKNDLNEIKKCRTAMKRKI